MGHKQLINKLQLLVGDELPDELNDFSDKQLALVEELLEKTLAYERQGMDSLFDSMTHTMKYIPNFLLQALTIKFIEPPIAARITEKLKFKQTVAVAKGISPEYLVEVTVHLESSFAVNLLEALPKQVSLEVVELLLCHYPKKLQDMCSYFSSLSLNKQQQQSLLELTS